MSDDDQRRETRQRFEILLEEVVHEEKRNAAMSVADEERLFRKVSVYLQTPDSSIGIFTIAKLAFAPPTIAASRLEGIAAIICEKVFQPVVYTDDQILKYTDFCVCFAYLEGTKIEGGVNQIVTFEQILITSFLAKLAHRFTVRERLMNSAKNYEGPEKERQKWIEKRTDKQRELAKVVDKNSARFLGNIHKLYPEILFKVLELLLKNLENETFAYLFMLLELNPRWNQETGCLWTVTNVGNMISVNWSLSDRFRCRYLPKLMAQSETLKNVTLLVEETFKDRANLRNHISNFTTHHYYQGAPQDFIKLSIISKYRRHVLKSKNDFEIDDEEETDSSPVYLTSEDFSSDCSGPFHTRFYEWCGMKVKAVIKETNNKE